MSETRNQTHIDAPIEVVWDLIADVERHPEWWPRVLEVEIEDVGEGFTYRQVTRGALGREATSLHIDTMREPDEFRIRCMDTGTFVDFALTRAQGGTFVDGRMGMDPEGPFNKAFDVAAGRMFFRRWLAASLDAMAEAAKQRTPRPAGRPQRA